MKKHILFGLLTALLGVPAVAADLTISQIQGNRHLSTRAGQVDRTTGIITKFVDTQFRRGFFIQAADTGEDGFDGDPRTSEAIFVCRGTSSFTDQFGTTLQVGHRVRVNGQVSESSLAPGQQCGNAGANGDGMPLTQMLARFNTDIQVLNGGTIHPLPKPFVIGYDQGHGLPPLETIYNRNQTLPPIDLRAVGSNPLLEPEVNGLDYYESLEGMRVQINFPRVTSPTGNFESTSSGDRYTDMIVLPDAGLWATGVNEATGAIVVRELPNIRGDFNPERVKIFTSRPGAAPALPLANNNDYVGIYNQRDIYLTGVMSYDFFDYGVLPDDVTEWTVLSGGLTPEITKLVGTANELTIGSFNVNNLAATSPAEKFQGLANQIVFNMQSPDILAVVEMQDDNGPINNGVVTADSSFGVLIQAINEASGGTVEYSFRQINPVNNQDGGQPGGNIRVGYLYKANRVGFVDRPAPAPSTTANIVDCTAGVPSLRFNPGRIDPANAAWRTPSASRKPLAAEWTFNGNTIFTVANHFTAKSPDDPLFGRRQLPILESGTQRINQATVERQFVQQILNCDANAKIVLLGDFNEFSWFPAMTNLANTTPSPLLILENTLPLADRYTFNFVGNSQGLDHILVSSSLIKSAVYDIVHVNVDFYDFDLPGGTGLRRADHEPDLVKLTLPRP